MESSKSIQEDSYSHYYTLDNLLQSKIIQKSEKLLSKYTFPRNFINFCDIYIKTLSSSNFILIKFPVHSFIEKKVNLYFPENSYFPISDALMSDEILHNDDLDYKGNTIRYPEFEASENKVSLSTTPGNKVSLLVQIVENTYEGVKSKRVTNRRGNKEIVGIIKLVYAYRVFKNIPKEKTNKIILVRSHSSAIHIEKMPSNYQCKKMQASYNYLVSQGFKVKYFDNTGNRCYCNSCFPQNWINSQEIAGETYIIPRGWTRFGLKTSQLLSKKNDIWNSWCNVFHGTNPEAAKSIIEHKTLLINKDVKNDGTRLGLNCSAQEWNNYYVTPHICYASHPWYSRVISIEKRRGKKRYAQIVLACKIRYGIYEKQRETEGGAKRIFDDYSIIPEGEIEWFSKRRGCVVPYGVLVRLFGETKKKEVEKLA